MRATLLGQLGHARGMEPTSPRTTIAGVEGVLVGADAAGDCWELRMSPERLAQFLARCGAGQAVTVSTPNGEHLAYARRWSVTPAGAELLVRVTLERSASA